MGAKTYMLRAVVLRKTKLGESDLILTMLAQDGSQVRAVAKGARKPTSPFASRLELYTVADVLVSCGKSLDIVKEARLVEGYLPLRSDPERATAAAVMAELLDRVTQTGLEAPQLFGMTCAAFSRLASARCAQAPLFAAAHLLKALAFSGLRPSLGSCAACGGPPVPARGTDAGELAFSCREGGVLCGACAHRADAVRVPAALIGCAQMLLHSTFDEIAATGAEDRTVFLLLQLCQEWIREHVGVNLKSLRVMLASGVCGGEAAK